MKATIIGGGIAGLTTAVGLEKLGLDYQLYESADAFKPVGAGIILSPNALYIFDRLGLLNQLKALGHPLPRFDITDATGRILQKNRTDFALHGKRYEAIGIHRADLHQALLSHIDASKVHLAHSLSTIDNQSGHLIFKNGKTVKPDLLMGCDGIHSAVRNALWPRTNLRYSGQTCWRGIADIDLAQVRMTNPAEMWGNGNRFGFVPIGPNKVYWYATAVEPAGQKDQSMSETKQKLSTQFRSFLPGVNEIIQATEQIMRHDLLDLKPLQNWSMGNAVLIGDAAHAMTPNLGQGAAQSIEDAWAIVNLLKQHGQHQIALAEFAKVRKEKVTSVGTLSWRIGQATNFQNRLICQLRNSLMRLAPESAGEKQKAKLFSVPSY